MKIIFSKQQQQWKELPPYSKEGIYIDGMLYEKLMNIRKIQRDNWDCVFLIDGKEGAGKSELAKVCGWILTNEKLTPDNFCKSAKETANKLTSFPNESLLAVDEGDIAFSSRKTFDREQQRLMEIIKMIRYKRMILVIIAPTFFDLSIGIAVRRSSFLLHVYPDEQMKRGRLAYFGEMKKAVLYKIGKKNFGKYNYPRADFIGRFLRLPFELFPTEYKQIKDMMIENVMKEEESTYKHPKLLKLQYNITKLKGLNGITYKEIAEKLNVDSNTVSEWSRIPLKYPFLLEKA